jgi:hypothetical protein
MKGTFSQNKEDMQILQNFEIFLSVRESLIE